MIGQRIGYIRVSSLDQNPARQQENMVVDKVFLEHASGKDVHRPELTRLLEFIREGDTVVIHSMDRLARNLDDLRRLVRHMTENGARVEFMKEGLVFKGDDSPMAHMMLSVMGAFAEFERALLRERQKEGIALARQKGLYRGRKRALSQEKAEELRSRVASGETKSHVARTLGISRETLYQYLKKTA